MAKTRIQHGTLESTEALLIWADCDFLTGNQIGNQTFLLTVNGVQQITQNIVKAASVDLTLLWSPDGSKLYIQDSLYDALYPAFRPPLGISLRRLSFQVNGCSTKTRFSPNGRYISSQTAIRIVEGKEYPVKDGDSWGWRQWVHDVQIFNLQTDKSHLFRFDDLRSGWCQWLKDGRLVVIGDNILHFIDPDEDFREQQLAHAIPFSWDISALSPSGTRAAWVLPESDWTLVVSDLQGNDLITFGKLNNMGSPPVWSPNGRQIAWVDESNERALYVIDANGTHKQHLVDLDVEDWGETVPGTPIWSSDSHQIAIRSFEKFSRTEGDLVSKIFVMNVNGENLRQVYDTRGTIFRLAWRPRR